jgi:hypothetical protein
MKNRWTWVALVAIAFGLATPLAYADDGDDDDGGAVASLDGESFISQEVSEVGEVGTSDVTGTCNLIGNSTFNFTITGVANGPYTGTFSESGTLTVNLLVPTMNTFTATFTIDSPAGDVTGSKSLAGASSGTCMPLLGPPNRDAVQFSGPVTYSATIETPGGATRTDSGTGFVNLQDFQVRDNPLRPNGHSFSESFVSNDPGGGDDDDDDGDDDD